MNIGRRIRRERVKRDISQTELASMLDNISNVQLSQIERGVRQPKVDEVEQICKALGISMSYLFEENEEKRKRIYYFNNTDEESMTHELDINVFQDRLLSTRVRKNLTREELSEHSEIPVEIITELETNHDISPEEYPTIETVFNLAAGLGVTPDYLYGYVDDEDEFSDKTPRIPDLEDFIENNLTVYKGTPLTRKDKERLKNVLSSLFFEAYERDLKNKKDEE